VTNPNHLTPSTSPPPTSHLPPATSSSALFERAQRVIPGGVNSPVRSFQAVGGNPVYMASGTGARLLTVEGRELIDYCGSWGALLFGHARAEIVEAVAGAACNGTSFGANTEGEVEFAERLTRLVPGLEMVRLVNSGTEAVMTAVRLARGFTGRPKILKFSGCYHGHADTVLVQAGSGLLTGGIAASGGVPPALATEVLVAPYNSVRAVADLVQAHGDGLAAILVEPVAANMGVVAPLPGFLEALRDMTNQCGALLIFDEVITGFRFGPTTFGAMQGVIPDLVCLGKIIGGGLPLGAVGGRAAVMRSLAPLGTVYQAGTLSGNPLAVAAGLATLKLIEAEPPYANLERLGTRMALGLQAAARDVGIPLICPRVGGMFTTFFLGQQPSNLDEVRRADTERFAMFFRGMLTQGIYLPPAQFEAGFISAAHSESDVDTVIRAVRKTLGASKRPRSSARRA
jgi:glutamate-1-semialdehyde 2,1-aminomutase